MNVIPTIGQSVDPARSLRDVAALFVETGGVYCGIPGVTVWDVAIDGRNYHGPDPVVAHPPCERWGRYAENHPIKGKIANVGDDGGKFYCALWSVRTFGGVLEHPKDSLAWDYFGLMRPAERGWQRADSFGGWTCQVEQGHYGHFSRKATWLYAAHVDLRSLIWGPSEQRIHPVALARHGYAKARRIGMTAMIGGKDKKKIRERTPETFRDLLLDIARSARASSNDKAPTSALSPGNAPGQTPGGPLLNHPQRDTP